MNESPSMTLRMAFLGCCKEKGKSQKIMKQAAGKSEGLFYSCKLSQSQKCLYGIT